MPMKDIRYLYAYPYSCPYTNDTNGDSYSEIQGYTMVMNMARLGNNSHDELVQYLWGPAIGGVLWMATEGQYG